jgi:hypothetical protein
MKGPLAKTIKPEQVGAASFKKMKKSSGQGRAGQGEAGQVRSGDGAAAHA